MLTAEQAKNNVLKYRKEQAERDYVQEELDSILDCIERTSLTGSPSYVMFLLKPVALNILIALEKLKELGYTITQEEICRKDFWHDNRVRPYLHVKISWCV